MLEFKNIAKMNLPPIKEAKQYAGRIVKSSSGLVETVLLDQWRRSKEKGEWRLTYLGQKIGTCSNDCPSCLVYNAAGGEDDPTENKLNKKSSEKF